ncbi:MAG: hypothetical protein HGB12_01845 [Bacteroidetes bacterium]|nr:hypothetical protein [Bacteroidota bacterium]
MKIKRTFISASCIMYVLLTFNFQLSTFNCSSQGIAINVTGNDANAAAMLDVQSDTSSDNSSQGLLIPRMSTARRNAITTPVPASLLIYNTTTKCFEFFENGVWQTISCSCTSAPTAVNASTSLTTLCAGSTLMLIGSATGATNWSWTGPNGFTSSSQSPAISNITTNGTGVYTLTASNACGTATAVSTASVTVNSSLAASVSIAAVPSGAICTGTSITFTATPTNGGTTPSYQWKKGATNISGETNSTYTSTTLANSDVITCVLTSSNACASSLQAISSGISMTVNPNPTASASNNGPVTEGGTLTLTGGNGSLTSYSWSGPNSYSSNSQSPVLCATTAMAGTYTITVTNSNGCTSSASTIVTVNFTCGNTLTDCRDGKTYTTVSIGDQCWMAQNLNYGNQVIINTSITQTTNQKWCYDDNASKCITYGGMYQWSYATGQASGSGGVSCNPCGPTTGHGGVRGLCPSGWHIPSDLEFDQMEYFIENNSSSYSLSYFQTTTGYRGSTIGSKMKGVDSNYPGWSSTNTSGFAMLPGGIVYGGSCYIGSYAGFWTASEDGLGSAWSRLISEQSNRGAQGHEESGYSVRCIKD